MLRPNVNRFLAGPAAKPLFFFVLLLPLAWLVFGAALDRLGANPAEALVRATGDWTLRMLCLVLLVTPLRVVGGLPALARLRRMVGLFVFFYVLLHFLAYGWLDMGLELDDIVKDIAKRPFILVGFGALILLTALAATSFNAAIRTLGAKRWRQLHRAVYAVAALAILHFYWMRAAKHNFAEVALYAAILGVLLGWRLWSRFSRPASRAQTAT
jgi:sulfoxide reductase heme-binding subunit YedZ